MASAGKRAEPIEAMPSELLREPLVWFFAEHFRHRELCNRLLGLSQTEAFDPELLQDVLNFLDIDLPMHVVDEEEDLFPLLRRRCKPSDRIEVVLGMLADDHADDLTATRLLKGALKTALQGGRGLAAYSNAVDAVTKFCTSQKRHIAVENAVVLPIARRRLTPADLETLGRRLAARRGLPDPFGSAS